MATSSRPSGTIRNSGRYSTTSSDSRRANCSESWQSPTSWQAAAPESSKHPDNILHKAPLCRPNEPSASPGVEDVRSGGRGDARRMSEGLSPSEVAKELRRHHEEDARVVIGRAIPVIEAVLLSVVTIVTAWAGYSAAKWSTESRLDLAQASSLRLQANRSLATAAELRNFDSSTFGAWFTAYTLGNKEKAALAERRFRPELRVAFDAWL